MRSRASEIVRGAAAFVLLGVLIVVPPLLLTRFVGWPLPRQIPDLHRLSDSATPTPGTTIIIEILACIAWLIWIQLAFAALAEIAGTIRQTGTTWAPAAPAIRLGIARLVATATLLAGASSSARVTAPSLTELIAAPVGASSSPAHPTATFVPASSPVVVADGPPTSQYIVQRNDSWWGIAERLLGDGARWREIRSANVGRVMTGGTAITPTTEVIHPGWALVVPGRQVTDPSEGEEIRVSPGESLWSIAQDRVRATEPHPGEADVASYWRELVDTNRHALNDPTRPDRIYPGERLIIPPITSAEREIQPSTPASLPVTTPAPAPEPLPAASSTTTAPQPPRTKEPEGGDTRDVAPPVSDRGAGKRVEGHPTRPGGFVGIAGSVLAAAVTAELVRRRRRRLNSHSTAGAVLPAPKHDDLRADLALHNDTDRAPRIAGVLHEAYSWMAEVGEASRVRVVQSRNDRVDLLLTRPTLPAPPGWTPQASGLVWSRSHLETVSFAGCMPCPTLVTIGQDDDTEFMLNLEAEQRVVLTGPQRFDAVRSWILELGTSAPSRGVSVVVAANVEVAILLERVAVAATGEDTERRADEWAAQSARVLEANRWPNAEVGRVSTIQADGLQPLVSVIAESPEADGESDTCGSPSCAVATVVVGSAGGRGMVIDVDADELRIPSIGLRCRPQLLTKRAADQILELLDETSHDPGAPSDAPQTTGIFFTEHDVEGDYNDPPHQVLVSVLGDIEVIGGSKKLTPKQAALVAYIALHEPVAGERIQDAVWAGPVASRSKRFANLLSECRAALGPEHLPASTDGRYATGPGVVTDLELFERRIDYARHQKPEAALQTLMGALDLVRGPVFTYRTVERASYVWVDMGNWASRWDLRVTDAAATLAQLATDHGEYALAVRAAERALTAVPASSALTMLLMRSHLAAGDTRAAERVFEEHQTALDAIDLDDVDPELVDLYHRLKRRRP